MEGEKGIKFTRTHGWLVLPEALDLFNKVKELFVNSSKENQSSIGLVTTVLEAIGLMANNQFAFSQNGWTTLNTPYL